MKANSKVGILKVGFGVVAFLAAQIIGAFPVFAASASLYLSPASGSVSKGYYLTVSVKENSGAEPVNAAQVNLAYPASQLSFVSITSSSAFSVVAENSGGGGAVRIGRGALPAVSGTQTIATVTFKALTNSGTASISIGSDSTVLSANSNSNIVTSRAGGSYTLKDPPAPAPAPVAAPKDTTPPTITNVKVTDITFSSAVISWVTSEPANSEISYGTTKSYGLAASDGNLVTDHKLTLNSPLIVPAQQYHFMVKSADGAGNSVSGPDGTFTTEGAKVLAIVTDQKNKPLKGAKVSLLDSSATTDKVGAALITNAAVGKQTLLVSFKGHTYSKTITVLLPDSKNTPQEVKIQIKPASNIWPIALAGLILAAGFVYLFIGRGGGLPPAISKRFPRMGKTAKPLNLTQSEPTVINPTKVKPD